jgi:hypothetical protein
MGKEELLKLREEIASHVRGLALATNDDGNSEAKLEVLMNLIRSGDSSKDLLYGAFETAQKLPEGSSKLNALLDLMYEIDAELAADEFNANIESSDSANEQPQETSAQ